MSGIPGSESKPMQSIREVAMALPGTVESTSCNKAAFKAGKKNFLFMGMDDEDYNLMLKLDERLADAEARSEREPDRYSVGKHGWVSMNFPHGKAAPLDVLRPWIEESFRVLAPKKLVAQLDE